MQFKKMVFPTDFSEHSHKISTTASALAARYGSILHVFHAWVLHDYDPHGLEKETPAVPEQTQEQLTALAKAVDVEPIDVVHHQERAVAAGPAIVGYARDRQADLIVMGTHGRRGFKHFLMGSVAEEVVRASPCPVLTLREDWRPADQRMFKKILIPVDFSEVSNETFSFAKEVARDFGAEIHILHVLPTPLLDNAYGFGEDLQHFYKKAIWSCTTKMKEMLKQEGLGIEAEIHCSKGSPKHEIVRIAQEEQFDLIIMGPHAEHEWEAFLLGSVTEHVVRNAQCPVMVYRKENN